MREASTNSREDLEFPVLLSWTQVNRHKPGHYIPGETISLPMFVLFAIHVLGLATEI